MQKLKVPPTAENPAIEGSPVSRRSECSLARLVYCRELCLAFPIPAFPVLSNFVLPDPFLFRLSRSCPISSFPILSDFCFPDPFRFLPPRPFQFLLSRFMISPVLFEYTVTRQAELLNQTNFFVFRPDVRPSRKTGSKKKKLYHVTK